ncbi:MAG: hypothetical protein ROO71_00400 [Balneola sp.]
MREIELPIAEEYILKGKMDMNKVIPNEDGTFLVPLGTILDDNMVHNVRIARDNGGKVLYATTSIEKQIVDILLEYFLGSNEGETNKKNIFKNDILASSAFSFRAKKNLLNNILNQEGLIKRKNKSIMQENLKTIMDWRNAFAHGHVKNSEANGCFVEYYSGSLKTLMLDDSLWDQVESVFIETHSFLKEILKSLKDKSKIPSFKTP